jgi:predicted dehydrogenase
MKQLIDEGYIGEVKLFESVTLNAQFVDPQKPLHWKMQRARANGGVFVEYGSHSIDLALWFGGPITSVVAHGVTLVSERSDQDGAMRAVDVDDAASWIATYGNGAEALFRTGWASLPVGGGGMRIYGSRGSLAWQLDPTTRRSEKLLVSTLAEPEPHVLLDFAPPFDPQTDAGAFPLGFSPATINVSWIVSSTTFEPAKHPGRPLRMVWLPSACWRRSALRLMSIAGSK